MSVTKISWFLFILLSILISIDCGANHAQAQKVHKSDALDKPPKLEAKLILYKNQYLLREPIWVKVQVTNVGSEPGRFYYIDIDGLKIQDSNCTPYPCRLFIDRAPTTINPGQTFEEHFNILTFYGAKEDTFQVHLYLPPQKYHVYYDIGYGVRSESDSFSVLEPEGDELKAMNLLKEAYNLQIQKKGEEFIGKLKELVQEYPNSHYCAYALLISANSIEEWNDVIDRFPDSREAIRAVEYIAGTYKNKKDYNGFKNAMQGFIKMYPNTDIAKEAENRLNRTNDKYFK